MHYETCNEVDRFLVWIVGLAACLAGRLIQDSPHNVHKCTYVHVMCIRCDMIAC